MNKNRIEEAVREICSNADERRYPEAFLSRYEPMECLGVSQWCETLLVTDRETGAPAVAKCYSSDFDSRQNEAELLKKLKHPSLPSFVAEFHNGITACVVRSYAPGVPLSDLVGEKPLPREAVIDIGIQLCDVLSYLHRQNPPVIHRDVKPGNIIRKPDGTIALIDFGISRTYDKNAKADTNKLGTESFAPPEQYGFSQTDCRSDLFSLGMVLCFLLTGGTELAGMREAGVDAGLRRVIEKCASFAPKDRYASAAQAGRALQHQRPKAKRVRGLLCLSAALLLCLGAGALFLCGGSASAVRFTEPLLEQAVRAVLGKSETERITAQELDGITGLYVFGTAVSKNQDDFYASAAVYYSGDQMHGSISSLEDLRRMPNLRVLCLAGQQIDDLSPLSALPGMEKVEFKHNLISDISVFSQLPKLVSVGLNDNPVRDISPLADCPNLRFLDLCSASAYDPAVFDRLGNFEFLDIANRTNSFEHLGNREIWQLKMGYTDIRSLACLSDVTGLTSLEVKHSRLTSLEGIEMHQELAELNIAGCTIRDLSPILALPALQTLVISQGMQPLAASLGDVAFSIRIE